MRTIGLVGGTTWLSTVEYYRTLNTLAQERLGGIDAARLILYSLNFGDMQRNNLAGDQDANRDLVVDGARRIVAGGAEAVMVCANTLQMFNADIEQAAQKPVISLLEAVAAEVARQGHRNALLLGTRYTMEGAFYRPTFEQRGIELRTPPEADRALLHEAIYGEMAKGQFLESTRASVSRMIAESGAECAILGCTELPVLLRGTDAAIPLLDTTLLHCQAAIEFMLG